MSPRSSGTSFRALLVALPLAFGAAGQQASDSRQILTQLDAVRWELAAATAQPATPGSLGALLDRRKRLLTQLMVEHPALAAGAALPADLVEVLGRLAPGAAVESAGEWDGRLEATVEDDFRHGRSRTRWHLQTEVRRFDLFVAASVAQKPGDRVSVRGLAVEGKIAVVEVRQAAAPAPAAQADCTTTGPQNTAVLMATSPSFPAFPPGINPTSVARGFFGSPGDTKNTDSLNGFWKEMSYGLTSVTGRVLGPFQISHDYTCESHEQIMTEAIAAADPTVDLSQFTRIAVLFPVGSCASFDGISSMGCRTVISPSRGNLTASASKFPIFPGQAQPPVALFAHELGHAIGLDHSTSEGYGAMPLGAINTEGTSYEEYGDPFSLMGEPYFGTGFTSGHYPAQQKGLVIHWLNEGDGYQVVSSPGTFTVAPLEKSAGVRGLRILRDAAAGDWLWVEYRQPIGDVDGSLQNMAGSNVFQGALIHHEYMYPTVTYLVDFTPTVTPNDFKDAALTAGQSWADPFTPLTLNVGGVSAAGLTVSVGYDTPCAATQFSATTFTPAGGTGTVTVTAPGGCSWTATAAPSWIRLTGAASGQGNGTVTFSVDANTNDNPARRGSISVGRQNTVIVQGGRGITVLSVSPAAASGSSGQFTVQFADTFGATDIAFAYLSFDAGTRCQIVVNPGSGWVSVGSTGFTLGAPGKSISSGYCTVYSDGTSFIRAGNQLTMTLQVSFDASFAGVHTILGEAYGSGAGWSGQQSLGIVRVTGPSCSYALSASASIFGIGGGAGTVNVTAPPGCGWVANSNSSWLVLTGGAAGSGNGVVNFTVAANPGVSQRSALVTLGGQTLGITQSGIVPQFLIDTIAGGGLPPTAIAGTAAGLGAPSAAAADAAGNVYFSVSQQHAIFKLDTGGTLVRVAGTGVGGFSGDGGPALSAQLNFPAGVALDGSGNLYVVDSANNRVRRVAADGSIVTVAGGGACCATGDGGPATSAYLSSPQGVAVDVSGNLYIGEYGRIRKVSGGAIVTVAGTGSAGFSGDGGSATSAKIGSSLALATDGSGNLYIGDAFAGRVRKVSGGTINTVAGAGSLRGDGGPATNAYIGFPHALAVDGAGNLFIGEVDGLIRKVANGIITTIAGGGSSSDDGPATSVRLSDVVGVAVDGSGAVYAAETENRIRRIAGGTIVTVAGGATGDGGPAPFGSFTSAGAIARDGAGNLYLADANTHRVRKISASGIISTVAGTGAAGFSGDNAAAVAAQLSAPSGVAVDAAGSLYIADRSNGRIRKVTNGIITTVAGGGTCCTTGEGVPAAGAYLRSPNGVAVDGAGNFYILEDARIRKVAAGTLSTFAGTGTASYSGDGGQATAAGIAYPSGMVFDGGNNAYFADNSNYRVRRIGADGIIKTVAGNGVYGSFGDGGTATSASLAGPNAVAIDGSGNLYITENGHRVRMVTAAGLISTIAGNSLPGAEGDGGPALQAKVSAPDGVAVDAGGNLYVADNTGTTIRLLTPAGTRPVLTVSSSHAGNVIAGRNATYTLTVANAAASASTSGTITVTEILPAAMTLTAMTGAGWTCAGATCTRSDSLAGGNQLPSITVTVKVGANAPSQVTNQATVSGGGAALTAAQDVTTVLAAAPPALSVTKTHSGTVTQGQANVAYTVAVSNAADASATSGQVTVTETIPAGLTLVSMAGTGWTCPGGGASCVRSDVLAAGGSYPPITVTANVAANAPALVTNQVSVAGGGSAGASATDPTAVASSCSYTVNPVNITVPPGGATGTLAVTTGAGCAWSATSSAAWLSITSGSPATGAGIVGFTAGPNGSGTQRSGTVTAGGQTLTVTQAASNPTQIPSLVSLSPFQGTGPKATLTLVYAHPSGWAAIRSAEFIIHPRWESNARFGGCYIRYAPGAGLFTLIANDGDSVAGSVAPGAASSVSNSQCTLNGATSSATGNGNTLTLVVALTFQPTFTGQRHIWMQATDHNNLSTNWLVYGVWFPTQTTVSTSPWYRIYDPFSKSYLYSFDKNEYDTLGTRGFALQGISGLVMDGSTTVGGVPNMAWYRVFVNATNSHLWTSDRNEFLTLINAQQAYVGEGVAAFVMPYINAQGQVSPQVTNTIPFYRAAFQGANLHFWTPDADEFFARNGKQLPAGYAGEGIACYIFPASGAQMGGATADDGVPTVASAGNGAIAAGQVLSVFGRHLAGTVLLNGVPARVVSARDNEVRFVAPGKLKGAREVTLEVSRRGRRSKPVKLTVTPANPTIFGTNPYGRGNAQARNEDGTANGPEHPALRGSAVTLDATGIGSPELPVEAHIGGRPADILSTRISPTRPGVVEVRVRVPEMIEAAAFQPVVLRAGNLFSQPGVGLAIR